MLFDVRESISLAAAQSGTVLVCAHGLSEAKPDAGRFMPEFKAPGNYKKPEAIADYIESAQQKWLEEAGRSPCTAVLRKAIVSIVSLNPDDKTFQTNTHVLDEGKSAYVIPMINHIANVATSLYGRPPMVVGFDVANFMKLAAWHHFETFDRFPKTQRFGWPSSAAEDRRIELVSPASLFGLLSITQPAQLALALRTEWKIPTDSADLLTKLDALSVWACQTFLGADDVQTSTETT